VKRKKLQIFHPSLSYLFFAHFCENTCFQENVRKNMYQTETDWLFPLAPNIFAEIFAKNGKSSVISEKIKKVWSIFAKFLAKKKFK
jgi:hypothetical protein